MKKKSTARTAVQPIKMYEELTWEEVGAAIKSGAAIMLPVGATEQHGEHLPLGTDNFQGIAIVKRAAARLAQDNLPLLLGPVIGFGLKPFEIETPKEYPGTVSLSSGTLKALMEEVCSELIRMGFRLIYLLRCHAESDVIIQLVAKELTEKTPAQVISLNYLVFIRNYYKDILRTRRKEGHGGEPETSRMLAAVPHLVHMDRARAYYPKESAGEKIEGDSLPYVGGAIGRYRPPAGMFAGQKGGITGNPCLATAEAGEKMFALITEWIAQIVKRDMGLLGKGRNRKG
jgi:creatinine amidohydrolase